MQHFKNLNPQLGRPRLPPIPCWNPRPLQGTGHYAFAAFIPLGSTPKSLSILAKCSLCSLWASVMHSTGSGGRTGPPGVAETDHIHARLDHRRVAGPELSDAKDTFRAIPSLSRERSSLNGVIRIV